MKQIKKEIVPTVCNKTAFYTHIHSYSCTQYVQNAIGSVVVIVVPFGKMQNSSRTNRNSILHIPSAFRRQFIHSPRVYVHTKSQYVAIRFSENGLNLIFRLLMFLSSLSMVA